MKRRLRTVIICLGIALLVSCSAEQESGPTVNGHPLSFWLKKLVEKPGGPSQTHPAEQAIKLAGTNAVPYLIAQLSNVEKIKTSSNGTTMNFDEAITLSGGAVGALKILGDSVEPAIPQLAQLMNSESPETVENASSVLSELGPLGAETILSGLTNKNPDARVAAAKWISFTGTNLSDKVPFLLKSLDHLDERTASECCFCLAVNYTNLPNVVPEFISHLSSTNAVTRCLITRDLGLIGTNASQAIPALQNLATDPSEDVRDAAKSSLFRIQHGLY